MTVALPPWLFDVPDALMIPVSALGIYLTVILFVRLNGLRSFSTMSAFDFAMTVATGTVMATTLLNPRPTLAEGMLAVLSLFLLQRVVAFLRRFDALRHIIDNRPRVLVRHGQVDDANLRRCHLTRKDLLAKMREGGVARIHDVDLAVMETTGRVSIVSRRDGVDIDEDLVPEAR